MVKKRDFWVTITVVATAGVKVKAESAEEAMELAEDRSGDFKIIDESWNPDFADDENDFEAEEI